jgi:hypothetical protein
MADICACNDKKCPSRTLCYRFTCEKSKYRQAYWAKSPRKKNAVSCEEFMSNEGNPDPTDDSVSTYKAPECRCNLYGMVHKRNPACQLFEIFSKPWVSEKVDKTCDKKRDKKRSCREDKEVDKIADKKCMNSKSKSMQRRKK